MIEGKKKSDKNAHQSQIKLKSELYLPTLSTKINYHRAIQWHAKMYSVQYRYNNIIIVIIIIIIIIIIIYNIIQCSII